MRRSAFPASLVAASVLALALPGCRSLRGEDFAEAFVAAALVGLLPPPAPRDPSLVGEDLRVLELDDGVWRHVSSVEVDGRPVESIGLVIAAPDGAVVIDTPWTEAQSRTLLRWVEQQTGRPPRLLIVTHSHADRTGGLAVFRARGIGSVGHTRTAQLLATEGRRGPDVLLDEALDVHLADETLAVRWFGAGHSPDNLVVWLERREILFGGCLIKSGGTTGLGNVEDADLEAWPATLSRCAAAYPRPQIVVPGHGAPGDWLLLAHTTDLIRAATDTIGVGDR
jgi:metallo-beta-lactamase class B